MGDLKTLALQLSLVQVARVMALEGQTRATSSELLFRARREFQVDALPSVVGQVLAALGIPTSISKGKSRFILDPEDLQHLQEQLSQQIDDLEARVDAAIRGFGNVAARLAPLEERYQRAFALVQREQQMKQFVEEHRGAYFQIQSLQLEAQGLQGKLAQQRRLQSQVQQMEQRLANAPDFQKRRDALAERMKELDAQQKTLAQQEKEVGSRTTQLQVRGRQITLAQLDRDIAGKRRELERLEQEIQQNRSLLDRLLRRNEGRNS